MNTFAALSGALRPVLAASLAGLSGLAMAAQVTVDVQTSEGRPAENVVVTLQPTTPWAPVPTPPPSVVAQKAQRFVPFVTAVPVGTTLRFSNEDRYDHHVRSQPGGPLGNVAPAKNFEFRLDGYKGGKVAVADVVLDAPGAIVLGCHIHGSMRGHVFVSPTPWVAVTDANGRAVIEGVPEGAADLRIWHPEQIVEQPGQRLMVGSTAVRAETRLNFRPPTRRVLTPPTTYGNF